MPARFARCREINGDITLAIETAGITDISIIIDYVVYVRCFSPTYTFKI